MKSGFVKVDEDVKLHFVKVRQEGKPVLMSHGFKDNWRAMLPIARKLPEDFAPILYDARAHGLSDSPDEGYSNNRMAEDLVSLCKQLEIKSPILFGHSMGANISVIATKNMKSSGLILEDPAGRVTSDMEYKNLESILEKWRLKNITQIKKELMKNNSEMSDEYSEILCLARKQLRPEISKISDRGFQKLEDLIHDNLPRTLLLRPDLESVSYSVEDKVNNPKIRRKVVSNSSHTIFRDNKEEFMSEVINFLKS